MPNSSLGHRELAKLNIRTANLPLAKHNAQIAIDKEPLAENYYILGYAHAASGDRPAAIAALTQALRLKPDNQAYIKAYESLLRR